MNKYTYTNDGYTFIRIPKNKARAAYNNNLTVIFCPVNMRPGYPWYPETSVWKSRFDGIDPDNSFEWHVDCFEINNCTNAETGRYTAFYVPVTIDGWYDLGETPRYTYDYSYMK